MVIGITGNSGSGKTEIAKILAKRIEAEIIDADRIARKLAEPGRIYYKKILELFGNQILIENRLNRRKIAEIIYSDSNKREKLNSLTYKYVVDEIKAQIEDKKEAKNIVIDAPLLFEGRLDKVCDFTIGVIADTETKIRRICYRDKIDEESARARLEIQKDNEYYKKNADYIINNNGKIEEIDLEELCIKIGMN